MGNKELPHVTIILPNWNDGEKVIRCLDSISKLNYPSYDVIVIDNYSTDGSKEDIKKKFKKVKIIENQENLGCVKAINQGFESAKGPFVLRLDSDVILEKNILKELVNVFTSNSHSGIVFPKLYYYSDKRRIDNIGFSISLKTGKADRNRIDKIDNGQFEKSVSVDAVPGSVLLTTKKIVLEVGPVSEDFFLFYEDADWCYRIRKKGYKIIYAPKAKAWHDCNKKAINPFKMYHYMRSKVLFIKRNSSFFQKTIFFTFLFGFYIPFMLSNFLLKGNFSLITPFIKGTKDGLTKATTLH